MNPAPLPTHVGDLRWPVQAAVRVQPERKGGPVEFVVVVDCGEGTPRHRFAVLAVYVWPDRVVTEQGVYDLTFDRAQQLMLQWAGLLPTVRVELVTVRDPDAANAHTVFIDGQRRDVTVTRTGLRDTGLRDTGMAASGDTGVAAQVRVVVCDIDAGDTGATPAWVAGMLTRAGTLSPAAATWAGDVVAGYAEDNAIPLL